MTINSTTRKNYSIKDSVRMVKMGLTPPEALRACNHPCSKQHLFYELNLRTANFAITEQLKQATADISPKVFEIDFDRE